MRISKVTSKWLEQSVTVGDASITTGFEPLDNSIPTFSSENK